MVGLGILSAPLDSSVNIAFPFITRAFDAPLEAIQWVVICYVLTYSSLMLVFGKLGDLFGHRRVFGAGLALSAIAYVLCGLASTFGMLLVFRVLQGIGTALVLSCGPALATMLFPETLRARVLGAYTMMFGIGSALGPSLGGLLIAEWGWERRAYRCNGGKPRCRRLRARLVPGRLYGHGHGHVTAERPWRRRQPRHGDPHGWRRQWGHMPDAHFCRFYAGRRKCRSGGVPDTVLRHLHVGWRRSACISLADALVSRSLAAADDWPLIRAPSN